MEGPVLATATGIGLGAIACTVTCVVCRIWRRNRYYKKVQHSLDEEERAFQETLARSYQDNDVQLDGDDKAKLQMLETYMQTIGEASTNEGADPESAIPTRAEDVDKFMQELAAAASGGGASRDGTR